VYHLLTISSSNNHIQDVLLVSYLANTIRTQIDLSNRLATAALTMGTETTTTTQESGQKGNNNNNQKRGNNNNNNNQDRRQQNRPATEA
jgi:translation initiation factor 3 subunit F